MKQFAAFCLLGLLILPRQGQCFPSPATPVYRTPETAAADPDFNVQGEYVTPEKESLRKGIQVVALGKGLFRVVIYTGGLPGAGWDRKLPQVIEEEETDGVQDLIQSLQASKISRTSPTLGATPPSEALVLFDGTADSVKAHWKAGAELTPDGFLSSGATTRQLFRDCRVHLEFRTPFMPQARGQARGNSGVYFQSRYETQVLDSFGMPGLNNETGAIYTVRAPDENLCLPPLSWQTYDVDFAAARWNDAGQKIANAKLTVRLNGVVVQRDVAVPAATRAAPMEESPELGPLYLQDHGNPVAFRNIWVVNRDADQEARRPRIPGYERFLSLSDRHREGGLVLLGELGCVKCHAAGKSLKSELLVKQAPILTDVGNRLQPEWMLRFIEDPHAAKPGTTMPNLFQGWNADERKAAALALTNFLVSTGTLAQEQPKNQFIAEGNKLFHTIGCVACHSPQSGRPTPEATSVPLPELAQKYTVPSLTAFLKNPHAVRPSGRMPSFNLQQEEAEHLSHYLMRQGVFDIPTNVHFKVYEGSWDVLPDFDDLSPVAEGTCNGFDLSQATRKDNFGIRFEGVLPRLPSLTAIFRLASDDGARLTIEGRTILDTDGIHPTKTAQKTARLDDLKVYKVRLDYFEAGGGEVLEAQVSTAGKSPQNLGTLLRLTPEPGSSPRSPTPETSEGFRADPSLIDRGRELFLSLGCVNCHELKEGGQSLKAIATVPPLAELNPHAGCLSEQGPVRSDHPIPQYDLMAGQRRALAEICVADAENQTALPEQVVDRTLLTFNCYSCHERQGAGGPEPGRNAWFLSNQHEMGDEGRLPPILTGVGDKLQTDWLKTVLDKGADNRPYMLTRMPRFGGRNVGHLTAALIALDRRDEIPPAQFDEPLLRIKSTGRELVGNGGLACIKCHTFGDRKATGIQAISLTGMTTRLREDWFLRYLADPAKYRPGTRMPTGYPNGKAVVKDIYHGNSTQQITAIWKFLSDGDRAGLPEGLVASMIELKPETTPILFRNFFEGSSPRGIAVGYPEHAHLIWDMNELCLRQIWHNRFMDASLLWSGRGQGQERPLGDHILSLEPTIPFAQLESVDSPWPATSVRDLSGYQCQGYRLNEKQQPAFQYEAPFGTVVDFPEPVAVNEREGTFRRHLTVTTKQPSSTLFFRAAIGKTIEPVGEGYRVNDVYTIRVSGGGTPFIRTSSKQQELLVPLSFSKSGESEIVQEILW